MEIMQALANNFCELSILIIALAVGIAIVVDSFKKRQTESEEPDN